MRQKPCGLMADTGPFFVQGRMMMTRLIEGVCDQVADVIAYRLGHLASNPPPPPASPLKALGS
jgi:hypothetical protein